MLDRTAERRLPTIAARLLAEAIGTAGLVAAVVGSGIAAERLSPDDLGVQLLESSIATAFALVALILAFGAVSGAHLNPAVTLADLLRGRIDRTLAAGYVAAQIAGGCLGAVLANLMFELPAVQLATNDRLSSAALLAEVVATFGLVTVIFGAARHGLGAVAAAVGGYIGAAYWFTSSTSFANPAVTLGRTLTDTFSGIAPGSAPGFIAAQAAGALAAVATARVLFPEAATSSPDRV